MLDNNAYSNIARTVRARLTAADPRACPRDREQAKRDLAAGDVAVSLGDLAREGRKLRMGATVYMIGRSGVAGPAMFFQLDGHTAELETGRERLFVPADDVYPARGTYVTPPRRT